MELTFVKLVPALALTFLVALVYASVGHGGASGYLALLSFLAIPQEQMAASALCLNLFVSFTAFWMFRRAGHFVWALTWPFLLASVPAAFLGGRFQISPHAYSLLLGSVLLFAAFRLFSRFELKENSASVQIPPIQIALPAGAGVGALSGIVGVGGGIFLSPLILLFRWASPKQTAAASALFIFSNSLAGLLGRMFKGPFEIQWSWLLAAMVLTAFAGGMIGSRLGANHFSNQSLKTFLAVILLFSALKLFFD